MHFEIYNNNNNSKKKKKKKTISVMLVYIVKKKMKIKMAKKKKKKAVEARNTYECQMSLLFFGGRKNMRIFFFVSFSFY
jgi:hypothetical protein